MIRHVHTPECQAEAAKRGVPCGREWDLEEPKTVTDIFDLKDFHEELHRRNRKPRVTDRRWWEKAALKFGLEFARPAGLLALLGVLSLAKHCGFDITKVIP